MLIFKDIASLQKELQRVKAQALSIGFIPTMGALHQGHVSLVKQALTDCSITVCSIFVNPTQFNDKSDLERYPRTPQNDINMLEAAGCHILFMPDVDEMYQNTQIPKFDLGYLNTILEAAHRPGHFDGVAQVVYRFFDIVKPNKAYFGSKDYQQVMVVKQMSRLAKFDIEIIACPIIREADGLAMSSRNTLLSASERAAASTVPLLLSEALAMLATQDIAAIKKHIASKAAHIPDSKLDYFEFANPATLEPLLEHTANTPVMVLIAIFIGKIRLIDNRVL